VPAELRRAGETELARCRRFGRSLSLLLVAPDRKGRRETSRLRAPLRRSTSEIERLRDAVEPHVRAYDSVVVDAAEGQLAILLPDAAEDDVARLRSRIAGLFDDPVRVGAATFPVHGAFIGDLVAHAHAGRDRTAAMAAAASIVSGRAER
jgi:hypothetical protein